MRVDDWIARGFDTGLPVRSYVEGRMNREAMQNRAALTENERLQTLAYMQQKNAYAQQQPSMAQRQQEEADLRAKLAEVRQVQQLPPEARAQWANQIRGSNPALANASPDEIIRYAEAGVASRLGVEIPQAPAPIEYNKTPWRGYVAMQDGKEVTSWNPPAPPQYGPTDVQRNWALRMSLPPEQRAEFDRMYGKGGDAATKPLPVGAITLIDSAKQAIAAAADSKALLSNSIAALESGRVQLGAIRNLESRGRNFAGSRTRTHGRMPI